MPAIVATVAGLALASCSFCHAQHPLAAGLPVLPPTAAAAGMAQQQAQMLALLDTNKNGRLDPAEIQAAQAGLVNPGPGLGGANAQASANMAALQNFLLSKFDANGNGVLDLPEMQAARMALGMASMGRGPQTGAMNQMGGANPFNGGNAGPPGKLKKAKPVRRNPLIARFDKNGDGKLDAAERKAMEAAKAKQRANPKRPAAPAKQARAAKHAGDNAVQ